MASGVSFIISSLVTPKTVELNKDVEVDKFSSPSPASAINSSKNLQSQRYSSDDLYKPRMVINSRSRRSRVDNE